MHTLLVRPKADPKAEPSKMTVSAHVGNIAAAKAHVERVCPDFVVVGEAPVPVGGSAAPADAPAK